jgi:hypothetical protein
VPRGEPRPASFATPSIESALLLSPRGYPVAVVSFGAQSGEELYLGSLLTFFDLPVALAFGGRNPLLPHECYLLAVWGPGGAVLGEVVGICKGLLSIAGAVHHVDAAGAGSLARGVGYLLAVGRKGGVAGARGAGELLHPCAVWGHGDDLC